MARSITKEQFYKRYPENRPTEADVYAATPNIDDTAFEIARAIAYDQTGDWAKATQMAQKMQYGKVRSKTVMEPTRGDIKAAKNQPKSSPIDPKSANAIDKINEILEGYIASRSGMRLAGEGLATGLAAGLLYEYMDPEEVVQDPAAARQYQGSLN
jgi:hypothetical protein